MDLATLVDNLEARYDLTDSDLVRQTATNVAHLQD